MKLSPYSILIFILAHFLTVGLWIELGQVSIGDTILFVCGWLLVYGLGASVGLHRIYAHRTHNLPPWLDNIVLFFVTMSLQGPSIWWTAMHRGIHHRFADTEKDLHSPRAGIAHAFFTWSFKIKPDSVSLKAAPDLLRKKNHVFVQKNYIKLVHLTWAVAYLVDLNFLLYFLLLPAVCGIWLDNLGNVVAHNPRFGYRNYDTKDDSTNVWWLAALGFGNGYHNNHHHDPKSYDFGTGVSGKWWEIDNSRLFRPFLKRYEKVEN